MRCGEALFAFPGTLRGLQPHGTPMSVNSATATMSLGEHKSPNPEGPIADGIRVYRLLKVSQMCYKAQITAHAGAVPTRCQPPTERTDSWNFRSVSQW